jgi:hypothetical protein
MDPSDGEWARRHADDIESGRTTVREVFVGQWSALEDTRLWDLDDRAEWRYVREECRERVIEVGLVLSAHHLEELLGVLTECFFAYIDLLRYREALEEEWMGWSPKQSVTDKSPHEYYNVFGSDMRLAAQILDRSEVMIDPDLAGKIGWNGPRLDWLRHDPPCFLARDNQVRERRGVERNPVYLRPFHKLSQEEQEQRLETMQGHASRGDPTAMKELGILAPARAIKVLPSIVRDTNHPNRGSAIFQLGEIGWHDREACHALIDCSRDTSCCPDSHRWRAVVALGKIGWPYAEDAVVDYLSNRDNQEYVRAIEALGHIAREQGGDSRAESFLYAVLLDESRPLPERNAALISLTRMRSPLVVDALHRFPHGHYCHKGELMAHVGGPKGLKALHSLFGHEIFSESALNAAHMRYRREG